MALETRTIWLVGMMGAGKSTVGPILAARLGRTFVDTDAEVESEARAQIATIFEREGEQGFRAREQEAIVRLAGQPVVVAVGGGAIAFEGNAERMQASGVVVHLRARAATLAARIGDGDDRPLLAGRDPAGRVARLEELLAERAGAYEKAQVSIDVDELDEHATAEAVLAALGVEA